MPVTWTTLAPNLWTLDGLHRCWLLQSVDHGVAVSLYRDYSHVWTRETTAANFDAALEYAAWKDAELHHRAQENAAAAIQDRRAGR